MVVYLLDYLIVVTIESFKKENLLEFLGKMRALRDAAVIGTFGLASVLTGCDNNVSVGDYTFAHDKPVSMSDKGEGYQDVRVQAYPKEWGRRTMIVSIRGTPVERIIALDSTENGDTRLWEEVKPIGLNADSPLYHFIDNPQALEDAWNAVYVAQEDKE